MKFREHKGSLSESMKTVIEVVDRAALLDHIRKLAQPWPTFPAVSADAVHIKRYCYDDRIDWDTYIVTLDGYGVLGFTDGPGEEPLIRAELDRAFGRVLRNLRLERKLSQEALAEEAGLSSNYLSVLERAQRSLTLCAFFQLAGALRTDAVKLMSLTVDEYRKARPDGELARDISTGVSRPDVPAWAKNPR